MNNILHSSYIHPTHPTYAFCYELALVCKYLSQSVLLYIHEKKIIAAENKNSRCMNFKFALR